jgi:hypothetical protein
MEDNVSDSIIPISAHRKRYECRLGRHQWILNIFLKSSSFHVFLDVKRKSKNILEKGSFLKCTLFFQQTGFVSEIWKNAISEKENFFSRYRPAIKSIKKITLKAKIETFRSVKMLPKKVKAKRPKYLWPPKFCSWNSFWFLNLLEWFCY